MRTDALSSSLARLFAELVDGAPPGVDAFILNAEDAGLVAVAGEALRRRCVSIGGRGSDDRRTRNTCSTASR
jgi:hypothetical protein